jgi:thioredoxin-related protein
MFARTQRYLLVALLTAVVALVGCPRAPGPAAPALGPPGPVAPPEGPAPGAGGGAAAQEVAWLESWDEAQARAEAEGKPLVIDFYMIPCEPCETFKNEVVPSAQVSQHAEAFVWVSINGEEETDLKDKFGVEGYPTVIIMKTDGEILYRQTGLPPTEEFAAALKEASGSGA